MKDKTKDYLIFIGIPKEIVEEREINRGYGYEIYAYPEYENIIPDPLPLDWLDIAKYAIKQKEYYLFKQKNVDYIDNDSNIDR